MGDYSDEGVYWKDRDDPFGQIDGRTKWENLSRKYHAMLRLAFLEGGYKQAAAYLDSGFTNRAAGDEWMTAKADASSDFEHVLRQYGGKETPSETHGPIPVIQLDQSRADEILKEWAASRSWTAAPDKSSEPREPCPEPISPTEATARLAALKTQLQPTRRKFAAILELLDALDAKDLRTVQEYIAVRVGCLEG